MADPHVVSPFEDPIFQLLENGPIRKIELIPWGSNYTFISEVEGEDGSSCLAVYKPRRGEIPLRDFPGGTLYKREVAAYRLSVILGWDMVPPTVIRAEGPHGVGSLQLYMEPRTDAGAHYDRLLESHRRDLLRMAVFDLVANNADRKAGHCLLDTNDHLWGIDHGLTFHQVPKLRTVIWEFCGQRIPTALLRDLAAARDKEEQIRAGLAPLLSANELEALLRRWDRLVEYPCFPSLDPHRNVPWPPF